MPMRCALGCDYGPTVHNFPSPVKFPERFGVWKEALGPLAASLTDAEIKKNLRLCDRHFIDQHRVRNNRLGALAVPCKNLPRPSIAKVETTNECVAIKEELYEGPSTVKVEITDDEDLNYHMEINLPVDNEYISQPSSKENFTDVYMDKKSPLDHGLLKLCTPGIPDALAITSEKETKPKLKRKFISLEQKIYILDQLNDGKKSMELAKDLDLNESTIRTIKQNENKIRSAVMSGSSQTLSKSSRVKNSLISKMEKYLMIWIEDCNRNNIPINGCSIKAKAQEIFTHLM